MAEIKAGDVVVLKSGGPEMTVEYIENEWVDCVWFKDKDKVKGQFHVTNLKTPSQPFI